MSFFSNKQTKFLNETSLGRIKPRRVLSLSRAFQKADLFKEGDISTSQGRRGRSRRSRLRDFCSSTVLVLSRSFSRGGRGRGREQIRGKMIIDAVNGPHHHRHRIKFIFCSFRKRARETYVLCLELSFRECSATACYMYCSQMRDVIKYLSLCICARVSQNINDEKICFAFYAVFQVLFLVRFFQFHSHVWLWGHSLSNGSLLKNPKTNTFSLPRFKRGRSSVKKFLRECALFGSVLHKKEAHTKLK